MWCVSKNIIKEYSIILDSKPLIACNSSKDLYQIPKWSCKECDHVKSDHAKCFDGVKTGAHTRCRHQLIAMPSEADLIDVKPMPIMYLWCKTNVHSNKSFYTSLVWLHRIMTVTTNAGFTRWSNKSNLLLFKRRKFSAKYNLHFGN